MSNTKFMYSIHPKAIIQIDKRPLRRPTSMELTKEQVLEYMKKATIYRRFNIDDLERVSTLNIDRLHNEKHMDEKEYKQFLIEQTGKDAGTVKEENKEEVTKKEETPEVTTENKEKVEEKVETSQEQKQIEETPVVEDTVKAEESTDNSQQKPVINTAPYKGNNKKNNKKN